jgi:hypothetical protein
MERSGYASAPSAIEAGRNIQLDCRWATGGVDRLQFFAKELVALDPDVLVAISRLQSQAGPKRRRARDIATVQHRMCPRHPEIRDAGAVASM